MAGIALRSLRHRLTACTASFLAMFFGAIILMAFGSLFDTSGADGVDAASRSTLDTMAAVVGGWGLLLVTFAVTSTLTLQVRQRAEEFALLRHVGATPAQLTLMIVIEAVVLALVAVAAAVTPAAFAGRWLLAGLTGSGQVDDTVAYRFGGFAIHLGVVVTGLAATVAAGIAARRATRGSTVASKVDAAVRTHRLGWKRIAAAAVFLFLGADLAVVTVVAMRGEPGFEPMATAGPASIWCSIGLALLAPALVRAVAARLAGPLERRAGVAGYLAALNLRQRPAQLATAAMPIILFTGVATGTLSMLGTDHKARVAAGIARTVDYRTAETTNLIVISIILLFCAIMVINTLVAATAHRRREFGQQRLLGATPAQVLWTTATEAGVLTVAGVSVGIVAGLFTAVPFAIARSTWPTNSLAGYLAVIAIAATIALLTSLAATRRAMRLPAVAAVAG